ncbi:toll/interleukin-1 receptor domain-containing protein [Sorangium sp. So ce367]|uniref:toll/interleukin-1 receptor domain-containing protein n=1 Tax=Sorangium sp. So ce367 TaxID=3133305 RepID=UPI003F61FD70
MTAPPRLLDLFISYAPPDEGLVDELEKSLAIMRRQRLIRTWHRGRIGAGEERDSRISNFLDSAQVVLLAVSRDFLAYDDCYELEMKRALERHDAGQARVIPIILRACDWRESPFKVLQPVPSNCKPLADWPNNDEFWQHVTQQLRFTLKDLAHLSTISPTATEAQHNAHEPKEVTSSAEPRTALLVASAPKPVAPCSAPPIQQPSHPTTTGIVKTTDDTSKGIHWLIKTTLPRILTKNPNDPAATLIRANLPTDACRGRTTIDQWTHVCASFANAGISGLINALWLIDLIQSEHFDEELSRWAASFIKLLIDQFGGGGGGDGDDTDPDAVRRQLCLYIRNESARWRELERRVVLMTPPMSTDARTYVFELASKWQAISTHINGAKSQANQEHTTNNSDHATQLDLSRQ